MKKLSVILVFVISLISFASSQQLENYFNSVIMIQSADKSATGTGFVIQSREIEKNLYFNTILSAEHIFVKPMYANTLKNSDGFIAVDESRALQIIHKNSDTDFAIACFLSEKKIPVLDLDFENYPKLRTKAYSIGCGLGIPLRFSEGIVTALTNSKEDYQHIITNVYTLPGDSGCPLFIDNKVVGIVSSIKTFTNDGQTFAANNISMSKPIKPFKALMQSNKYRFCLSEKEKIPELLKEWIWLMDTEIKFN